MIRSVTGLPRQGKSYHTHVHEVIPALRAGHRVVTNIAGYELPDVQAQICVQFGIPLQTVQRLLVPVTMSELQNGRNYPCDVNGNFREDTLIQPGDRIIVDEAYIVWDQRGAKSIPREIMAFMRLHGKFVGPLGETCQVILITQDINDLHKDLRVVVERDHEVVKFGHVGFKRKYRVTTWLLVDGRRKLKYTSAIYTRTKAGESSYRSMFAKSGESEGKAETSGARKPFIMVAGGVLGVVGASAFLLYNISGGSNDLKPVSASTPVAKAEKGSFVDEFPQVKPFQVPPVYEDDMRRLMAEFWAKGPEIYCWPGQVLPTNSQAICDTLWLHSTVGDKLYYRAEHLPSIDLKVDIEPCALEIAGAGIKRRWIRGDCYSFEGQKNAQGNFGNGGPLSFGGRVSAGSGGSANDVNAAR